MKLFKTMDLYKMEKVFSFELFEEQTVRYERIDNLFDGFPSEQIDSYASPFGRLQI